MVIRIKEDLRKIFISNHLMIFRQFKGYLQCAKYNYDTKDYGDAIYCILSSPMVIFYCYINSQFRAIKDMANSIAS